MKTPQADRPTGSLPRRGLRKRAAMFALGIALILARSGGHAQGTNALPYSTGYLVTGDYIVGGVDLTPQQNPTDGNGLATGTIHMAGVPPLADIQAAYLYFEVIHAAGVDPLLGVKFRGSTLSTPSNPLAGIRKFQSTSLGGNNLSQCWGAAGGSGSVITMVRADVLHLLPKLFDKDGQWTGKRLVNDTDLGPTGNLDTQGNPYPLHTVSLREGTGDQALQSAGATLLVIYRVPTDPLRKVVFYDGVFTPPEGTAISQTISGFYKHAGNSARLTYIGGSGANNQTEALSFNGAPVSIADPFPQTSPSSDRSWANTLIPLTGMSGAATRNAVRRNGFDDADAVRQSEGLQIARGHRVQYAGSGCRQRRAAGRSGGRAWRAAESQQRAAPGSQCDGRKLVEQSERPLHRSQRDDR